MPLKDPHSAKIGSKSSFLLCMSDGSVQATKNLGYAKFWTLNTQLSILLDERKDAANIAWYLLAARALPLQTSVYCIRSNICVQRWRSPGRLAFKRALKKQSEAACATSGQNNDVDWLEFESYGPKGRRLQKK